MSGQTGSAGSTRLFDRIAPLYSRSFRYQYQLYLEIYQRENVRAILDATHSILDVGCGTGAMACALHANGYQLTGVDASLGMLRQAKRLMKPDAAVCILSNAATGLPFTEKQFDACLASYVAHGLKPSQRISLYAEMRRMADKLVIIHDYTEKRTLITSVLEWGEGGDYFNFIHVVREELLGYFGNLQVIPVEPQAALYVCRV